MTVSEEIKLQAKLLEWEAPKGLSANLKGYNTGDYIWITNGIVVARIYSPYYMLNVLPSLESIKGFTKLPEDAVKGWLTETRFKDKERYKAGVVCKDRESILALAVKMLDVTRE